MYKDNQEFVENKTKYILENTILNIKIKEGYNLAILNIGCCWIPDIAFLISQKEKDIMNLSKMGNIFLNSIVKKEKELLILKKQLKKNNKKLTLEIWKTI